MSSLKEMGPGTHFQPVLGDDTVNSASVTRVVFCSGKHYYALAKQRETTNSTETAIIRLEVCTWLQCSEHNCSAFTASSWEHACSYDNAYLPCLVREHTRAPLKYKSECDHNSFLCVNLFLGSSCSHANRFWRVIYYHQSAVCVWLPMKNAFCVWLSMRNLVEVKRKRVHFEF